MASTYVNNLRLNEMATGDGSGTWGTTTNTNLELIGQALGYGTRALANASTDNITIADGASDSDRALYLKLTGGGQACTVTLLPNTVSKVWMLENATSYTLTFTCGSGANVAILAGETKIIATDGGGSGGIVYDVLTDVNLAGTTKVDDLTVGDDLVVGGDIDLEGAIDVNGTANLDIVDIDGAVDMASSLQVDGVITTSDGMVITTADNTDTLELISTDADADVAPNLRLYRNSGSPADSDQLGKIQFEGRNDNSQDVIYSEIINQIKDASDGTEDGRIALNSMVAGTLRARLDILPTETVFNDGSVDLDFRVESDTITHALFVDGALGNVGIGAAPKVTEAGWTNLSVGGQGALINSTAATAGGRTQLSNNVYIDESGNYSFISTDEASLYKQIDGTHSWLSAASGSADAHMTMLTRMSITLGGEATHYGALNVNTTAGDGSEARFNVNPGGAGDNCTVAIKQDDASTVGVYLQADGASWFTGGINPSSGDTTAANVLDEYEEGTWTPTWTGANSGGATYTRIGRVVYASGTFTATGSGTSGDCAGLPYTSTIDGSDGGGSGYHAQDTVTWSVLKTSGAGFRFYTGSSQIQLTGSNGTRFFLTYNV